MRERERQRERERDRESTSKESINKRCSAQHDHTYIVCTFFCTLLIFIRESLSCGVIRSFKLHIHTYLSIYVVLAATPNGGLLYL